MACRMLILFGVKRIILAGFDGYSHDVSDNYFDGTRILMTKKTIIDATNQGMADVFRIISGEVKLEFLTSPIHFHI